MSRKASLFLAAAILLLAAWAVWTATAWPLKAKLFPLAIGIPMLVLAAVEVLWSMLERKPAAGQEAEDPPSAGKTLVAAGWLVGFFAVILLLGFLVAVPLFVLGYLRLQGRESWTLSLVFTAVVWGAFYGLFDRMLHLPFPQGWLIGLFA
jgi:hypothetical protein